MTLIEWIGLVFSAGLGAMVAYFRKLKNMPSTDNIVEIELKSPVTETKAPDVIHSTDSTVIPEQPVNKPESVPVKANLINFCTAIRDFEGQPPSAKNPKGDQNYRLNNPGNCRYNEGGYLPMYGIVGKSKNGFAIFEDYTTGWNYLKNMIKAKIHLHPNQTIEEFMWVYAPPADDNPTKAYAAFIGKRLGVDSRTFLMKNLL